MKAEVFAFGQELADESVGVFVDAALPGRVRVGKVDLDSGIGRGFRAGPPIPRLLEIGWQRRRGADAPPGQGIPTSDEEMSVSGLVYKHLFSGRLKRPISVL